MMKPHSIRREFWTHFLACKYWLQGDEWDFALSYARALVYGWRNNDST